MTKNAKAQWAGPVTPRSDSAPWQARVGSDGEVDNPDSAEAVAERKRLTKPQAPLALQVVVAAGNLPGAGQGSPAVDRNDRRPKLSDAGISKDLRFRLKAAGWTLIVGAEGDFTVSRWGQMRALTDLAAVERFARQVGVEA